MKTKVSWIQFKNKKQINGMCIVNYMFRLNDSLMPDKKAILYNLKNPVLARLKSHFPTF